MRLMGMATIVAVFGGIVLAQDDAKVQDLIQKLGDNDFAAREKAQSDLIELGAPALAALQEATKSSDAEIATRSKQIIEEIRKRQAINTAIKRGTKVTLKLKEAALSDVAKALGEATKLDIRVPEGFKDHKVSIEVENAELLRVLDSLARQVKQVRWRFDDARTLSFVAEPFVDYPAAYSGPFKFKLVRTRAVMENDFTKKSTDLEVTVAVEAEPGTAIPDAAWKIVDAIDDAGAKLHWEEETPAAAGPNMAMSTMTVNGKTIKFVNGKVIIDENGAEGGKTLTMHSLPGNIAKLKTLRLDASFSIPTGAKKEISFANPKKGDTVAVGATEVLIEEMDGKSIEILVKSKEGGKLDSSVLDASSLSVKSGDKEYSADVADETDEFTGKDAQKMVRKMMRKQQQWTGSGEPAGYRFVLTIPKAARQNVDSVKLSINEHLPHHLAIEFSDPLSK